MRCGWRPSTGSSCNTSGQRRSARALRSLGRSAAQWHADGLGAEAGKLCGLVRGQLAADYLGGKVGMVAAQTGEDAVLYPVVNIDLRVAYTEKCAGDGYGDCETHV